MFRVYGFNSRDKIELAIFQGHEFKSENGWQKIVVDGERPLDFLWKVETGLEVGKWNDPDQNMATWDSHKKQNSIKRNKCFSFFSTDQVV